MSGKIFRPEGRKSKNLFDLDFGSGFFQLRFKSGRILFGNALFNGFAAGFNKVFRFFETQSADLADDFDDIDFLRFIERNQNDVKFALFFGRISRTGRTGAAGNMPLKFLLA